MIFKKLFEIFHCQKIGEGAKESLARYTAKKSKRNIKNCGLHTQPKYCFRECNSSLFGKQFYSGKCYISQEKDLKDKRDEKEQQKK